MIFFNEFAKNIKNIELVVPPCENTHEILTGLDAHCYNDNEADEEPACEREASAASAPLCCQQKSGVSHLLSPGSAVNYILLYRFIGLSFLICVCIGV